MTAFPRDLLASWPGRWRHPDLAAGVAVTDADADTDTDGPGPGDANLADLADLVLLALAAPHTVLDTADRLIEAREFDLVETLLREDTELTHHGTAVRVADRLAAAVRDDDAALRLERSTLATREQRVGLSSGPPPSDADGANTPKAAWRALKERRARVEEAEADRAEELGARLESVTGPAEWKDRIRDALRREEFAVADRLITAGPNEDVGRLLPIPRVRVALPRTPKSLSELLGWYRTEAYRELPAEFAAFRLHPADDAGQALVAAISALMDGVDDESVTGFATALEHVLGHPATPRVEAREGGRLAWLFGLRDERLPALLRTGRSGTTLWVSGGAPPPEDLREPVLWFVPALEPATGRPPRTAILGPEALLRLLARPDAEAEPRPDWRRINCLRMVLAQFGVKEVLQDADELCGPDRQISRQSLAALLDLWNVDADGGTLDILAYLTGGHPVVTREILDDLLGDLGPSRELDEAGLMACRTAEAEGRYAEELYRSLADDPEAHAVLLAVLTFYADDRYAGFTETDVRGGIEELAGAGADAGIDVAGALARLHRDLLLDGGEDWEDGYRLPSSGICDILTHNAAGIADRAAEALRTAAPPYRLNQALRDLAIVKVMIQALAHKADNLSRGIVSRLDAVAAGLVGAASDGVAEARADARRLNGDRLRNAVAEATRHHERLDLYLPVFSAVQSQTKHVEIELSGTQEVPVIGNMWQLQAAVEEVLANAVRAVERSPRGDGRVDVRLRSAQLGSDGRSWAVLDVEDTGMGMTETQLIALRSGARFSAYGGQGIGLAGVRHWITDHGGVVEVLSGSDRLGGAHVRIRLPMAGGEEPELDPDRR